MGSYRAEDAKSYEYQGADTFRLTKPGERAQVVFLYSDEASIDGFACHRLENASHYTFVVDCARNPKDDISKCPACAAGDTISTRVFVRMLDLASGKVLIWDKPASFRKTLAGFIHYFNPLYKQKYEITREGSGLETRYQFQSIGDSGISPEQFAELIEKATEAVQNYVRPAEKYQEIKARCENSVAEASKEQVNVSSGQQSAWGQPPQQQNGWGQPPQQSSPQQNGWGQPPQQSAPQQGGWGQPPQQQNGWPQPPQVSWQNNPGNN